MDLDAFGRKDLSDSFLNNYNQFFQAMKTSEDSALFIYYKMYRANIRAKVNGLRAKSASSDEETSKAIKASEKYLHQMKMYLDEMNEV